MKKLCKPDIMLQALKAAKRDSRNEEIAKYGKPICWTKIEKDKTKYTRKQKHKSIYTI